MRYILFFTCYSAFAASTSQVQGLSLAYTSTPLTNRRAQRIKHSSLQMSIPNNFDTATSGFASIARLPFGTNVVSPATDDQKRSIRIKALYDIEQSKDCREVRERITELDLVVETVIPSAPNSRTLIDKSYKYFLGARATVPTMIVEKGEEYSIMTLEGVDSIMHFFDSQFGPRAPIIDDIDDGIKSKVVDFLIEVVSKLPGIVRAGRGDAVAGCALSAATPRPRKPLVLYSYEGNQFCRLVREVLTELDVPYVLRSAGKGSSRRAELAAITGGSTQCPYLLDPNTDAKLSESKDIIQYLYKNYALYTPPNELLGQISSLITPILKPIFKTLTPLQAGSNGEDKTKYNEEILRAKSEIEKEINNDKIVIYTYSLSPFCTEAIGVLDSLSLNYKEISLGAEWVPFLINEGGSQKRMALFELTGQSSLPHVFVNGKSIGGLYEGLLPSIENGDFLEMIEFD